MELEEAVHVLSLLAGRASGVTTPTRTRDAARVVLGHLSVQGEPEWEYGIEYSHWNEEFEGQDLATIERRVKNIRQQGGYYSKTVRAMRRRPAGDSEPVQDPEGEEN